MAWGEEYESARRGVSTFEGNRLVTANMDEDEALGALKASADVRRVTQAA